MHGTLLILMLACVLFLPGALFGATGADYAGWKACSSCHEDVTAKWERSGHASAFDSLKKSAQETLPACTGCHATGYGHGGFVDSELTPNLAAVQCEACHGPGARHVASPGKQTIIGAPGVETCRQCHTPGQDPGFDYTQKAAVVHSAAVQAVKVVAGKTWLKAAPEHANIGTVDEGTPAKLRAVVENTGPAEVTVKGIRTN